jgi:RND family efflux transporter MFP subunit
MEPSKPTLDDLRIERRAAKSNTFFGPGTILAVLVGVVCVVAVVWWFTRPKPIAVRTALVREVSAGSAERTVLNASGYVTARRAATVSSKVTGKVIEVLVEEGIKVKQNDVLARLDDTNVRAALRLAEAQLDSSKAALEETKVRIKEADQELQRQSNLVTNKIATQADFDHAEAASRALIARLEQQKLDMIVAERQVATWQQQLEDTVIRAPFAGIVTSKNAQPGEVISPMSAGGFTRTVICTIVDMESLEVEIDVNESYINRVENGQPVVATLDAYPEWKIPCKVIAIIPTADRQKSTVKVRVGFEKLDRRILPEMGVKVAFQEAPAPGSSVTRTMTIPKTAVQQQNGREVVFVLQNERAERRAVTIASTINDEATISSGLTAGEKVVLDAPPGLTDGAAVKEVKP